MRFTVRLAITVFLAIFFGSTGFAQCVQTTQNFFANPSFEGTPMANIAPAPWVVCMPGQTPDIQPGVWGVTLAPSNGGSYVGLVAEPSANWQEGVSQQLSTPFIAGITYTFTVDLANSSSTGGGIDPGCAECQIWGGFGACDQNTLLWHSGNIAPYDTFKTYTVTFTPTQNFTWCMFQINSLGCSTQPYILIDNISPVQSASIVTSIQVVNNDHCSGDSTGRAVLHVIDDSIPFSYAWSAPRYVTADTILSNAPAGTYTVTVTDAHACSSTASVTITQPAPISLIPDLIQPTCALNAGSAYMSYAGGTEPMQFIWSNGDTAQSNPNLFAGLYSLTVTDANGCRDTGSINVVSAGFTITGVVTNATCGNSNGSIAVTVTGDTLPVHYTWSTLPVQTTDTITGLAAGAYTVTVTDTVGGCSASSTFLVSQPPNGMSALLTASGVLCYGQSNGSVNAVASGGSPPYTYLWSNGNTTAGISALAAGLYTVTVHDQSGCGFILDTLLSQQAQIRTAVTATLCAGGVYPFNGHNLNSTGIFNDTLPAHNGCDSIVTLNLTVLNNITHQFSQNICGGETYNFNGRLLNATGNYTDTLTAASGCDSIVTLSLSVAAQITTSISATICHGSSYGFNNTILTAGGIYADTLTAQGGCDSIVALHLVELNDLRYNYRDTICYGGHYNFYGHDLTTNTSYTQPLTSVLGCDSSVTVQLFVMPQIVVNVKDTICSGASFLFNGLNLTTSGLYNDTLSSAGGCDSLVKLNLMVLSGGSSVITENICTGSSYNFNGQALDKPGTYIDTVSTINGCDSVVTLHLNVNPLPIVAWNGNPDTAAIQGGAITLTGGSPTGGVYSGLGVWNGKFYPDSVHAGTYTLVYEYTSPQTGCSDSVHKSITVIPVGISDISLDNAIRVFPNPAEDIITAESDMFVNANVVVNLYDVTGKQIMIGYEHAAGRMIFNLQGIAAGTYLLRFKLNGLLVSKRFVKLEAK